MLKFLVIKGAFNQLFPCWQEKTNIFWFCFLGCTVNTDDKPPSSSLVTGVQTIQQESQPGLSPTHQNAIKWKMPIKIPGNGNIWRRGTENGKTQKLSVGRWILYSYSRNTCLFKKEKKASAKRWIDARQMSFGSWTLIFTGFPLAKGNQPRQD